MLPREILAVVFDMDGTVFDTERLYFAAEAELLARRGLDCPIDLAQRIMGLPGIPAMELLRRECRLADSAQALFDECQAIFQSRLATDLRLMPGFLSLFERVEHRRLPRAIATSTRRPLTERMLGQFNLADRFHAVLTGDDVTNGKPHPEIFHLACRRLSVAAVNTLVIEDSRNGSLAAKAADCICVAVPHPLSRSADFTHVDYIAGGLDDPQLIALIDGNSAA